MRSYIKDYKMLRELKVSRKGALMGAIPFKLQMIWALIKDRPVAYKLKINVHGEALYFDKGSSGARISRCVIRGVPC